MSKNFGDEYQYNSCVSRGICSINPRTSSLQEIVILYLKQAAYYAVKLKEFGNIDLHARNFILNAISIMVSNSEFSEIDFENITKYFRQLLPDIIKKYKELCSKVGSKPILLKGQIRNTNGDIIKSIRLGEREFLKKFHSVDSQLWDLYKILFVLAKSICINVLDLETYGENTDSGYFAILSLLDMLNSQEQDKIELKTLLKETAAVDHLLMKTLRKVQIMRYGRQRKKEVSYTTTKGKAILVVGSNIRELELVLDSVKGQNIDVYTHDEMMLAHTFPKFLEYKNLKGQFGQGLENCLLDFATFPGPIILTRHSLYNVENLYRGRLYTTDIAYSKGVIPIKDGDFSEVIKSAKDAKGFKKGKICVSELVGFDYESAKEEITAKITQGKYKRVVLIGLNGYTKEDEEYFSKMIKLLSKDTLIISLSCCSDESNVLCYNACFDTIAPLELAEHVLSSADIPLSIFFPICDRHTISKMIYLKMQECVKIFVGKCTPIMLNPSLMNTLRDVFVINEMTTVKKDLVKVINEK